MITVKFKKLHKEAKLPFKATKQAGAYDVYATEIIKESESVYLVKLGFAVEFPPTYKLMFCPRSSLTKTPWVLQNSPGIGDSDFRGEYSLRFRTFIQDYFPSFPYKVGDRVAQCYFQQVIEVHWRETENLNETERGGGAYGSTGK